MDKRILKTMLVLIISVISGLLMPIFGQWYKQKTGMEPVALYAVGGLGGLIITIISALKIWGEIE
jgi:hypothetical protein